MVLCNILRKNILFIWTYYTVIFKKHNSLYDITEYIYIYTYLHVYTIFLSKSIHNIPFKKCVAFLWESSLQDAQQSLWKSMAECGYYLSSCTKGNPFIYTAIPLKEGDVSVRKRNAWNCHLKKTSIPCRKYSIIMKEYSSISSCTLREHGIPWGQCSMPLCSNIFVHSFEKKGGIPCSEENYTNRATTARK